MTLAAMQEGRRITTIEGLEQNGKLRVTVLPYHPGAVRYYREIGIALPDNLNNAE
jgi:TRAP-type uncharacterized transport system substrate-binding protein